MRAATLALAVLLAGCTSAKVQQSFPLVTVRPCDEPTPSRPVMPTEQLTPPVDPDRFAQAAISEIDRREGYEIELVTALENCKKQ